MECLKRKRNTKIGCGELLMRRIKVGRGRDAQTRSIPLPVRSHELWSSLNAAPSVFRLARPIESERAVVGDWKTNE